MQTVDCAECQRGLQLVFGMMQRAAGAVISNGEWVISFFSQVSHSCFISRTMRRSTTFQISVCFHAPNAPMDGDGRAGPQA